MGKCVFIPWVGGQNTMGRRSIYHGYGVHLSLVGVQNTMGKWVFIPWIGSQNTMGRGR